MSRTRSRRGRLRRGVRGTRNCLAKGFRHICCCISANSRHDVDSDLHDDRAIIRDHGIPSSRNDSATPDDRSSPECFCRGSIDVNILEMDNGQLNDFINESPFPEVRRKFVRHIRRLQNMRTNESDDEPHDDVEQVVISIDQGDDDHVNGGDVDNDFLAINVISASNIEGLEDDVDPNNDDEEIRSPSSQLNGEEDDNDGEEEEEEEEEDGDGDIIIDEDDWEQFEELGLLFESDGEDWDEEDDEEDDEEEGYEIWIVMRPRRHGRRGLYGNGSRGRMGRRIDARKKGAKKMWRRLRRRRRKKRRNGRRARRRKRKRKKRKRKDLRTILKEILT